MLLRGATAAGTLGKIGAILVLLDDNSQPAQIFSFSAEVPDVLKRKWDAISKPRHRIAQIEMFAAATLLHTFRAELQGYSLVIHEDCDPVNVSLTRGSARNPLTALLCLSFWVIASAVDVLVWVERVSSRDNLSDGLSRGIREVAFQMGAIERIPSFSPWLAGEQEDLLRVIRHNTILGF